MTFPHLYCPVCDKPAPIGRLYCSDEHAEAVMVEMERAPQLDDLDADGTE